MMLCLGLTGGIGSGKSYVSNIFAALGIPVYEADSQTKLLYARDKTLRFKLMDLLGEAIYRDGMLQKEEVAAKIFADPTLLEQVNSLVHPVVMEDFSGWMNQQHVPYVILESAIILETPFASTIDRMVTVSTPIALRIERLCHRDNASMEDAKRRMERQWSDSMREAKSHFVVYSNGKSPLLPQVLAIHQAMLALVKEKNGCGQMD